MGKEPLLAQGVGSESTSVGRVNWGKFAKLLDDEVVGLAKEGRRPVVLLGTVWLLEGVTVGGALVKSEKLSLLASNSVVAGRVAPNDLVVRVGGGIVGKETAVGSALEKPVNSSSSSSSLLAVVM